MTVLGDENWSEKGVKKESKNRGKKGRILGVKNGRIFDRNLG